jgi:CubicO group peptidase (beta-lactamase class C family)
MGPRTALGVAVCALAIGVISAPARAKQDRKVEGVWNIRIERPKWTPAVITGQLVLDPARKQKAVQGRVHLREVSWRGEPIHDLEVDGSEVSMRLVHSQLQVRLEGKIDGKGVLAGTSHWPQGGKFAFTAERAQVLRYEADAPAADAVDPATVGLLPAALDYLVLRAQESGSDALVIVKDGQVVCDRRFGKSGGKIHTMSVTKAVAGLAIPFLIAERKVKSLDDPLSRWFPSWKKGDKSKVTLRHLLTHTTGLHHNRMARELNAKDDRVAFAADSELDHPPGTHFSYNNRAMALLAGVVKKASGKPIDTYLDKRLFKPLGITDWAWNRDGAGNPVTYAELQLSARDLAKIGELVTTHGRWGKKQLIAKDWFEDLLEPGTDLVPFWGIVWKLVTDPEDSEVLQTKASLAAFEKAGYTSAKKLEPLTGRTFANQQAYFAAFRQLKGLVNEDYRSFDRLFNQGKTPFSGSAPVIGVTHTGWLGQHLVIYPEWNLVGVRLRRMRQESEQERNQRGFGELATLLAGAVRR